MIPKRFAYAIIILVLSIFTVSAYFEELRSLAKKAEFWISFFTFFLICTILDLLGLHLAWWQFSKAQTIGIYFLHIPLEEFCLFALVFALALSAWEATG